MRDRMRVCLLVLLAGLQSTALAEQRPAAQPERVAAGAYYAPRFAPDGTSLLVTGERMHGLSLVDLATGSTRTVTQEPRAGVGATFTPDGRVAFAARIAGTRRMVTLDRDGAARTATLPQSPAFAHGDRIYLRADGGIIPLGSGDRFFDPIVSPDGQRVAFVGLATGIYVYDMSAGTLAHVGAGTAPAWSPDSTALAYERTEDDGHEIVGSDIWLWRASTGAAPLLATTDRIERRPSWSPAGDQLAFDDDQGAIYIVSVQALSHKGAR